MDFRTIVNIPQASFRISPCERMLFVGSCFADNIGRRFQQEQFRALVNPFGVMYNPASILHTVERLSSAPSESVLDPPGASPALPFTKDEPGTAVFTLGTSHVYILKETGEIVDNCQKRPQALFQERELTVDECADYLRQAISLIHSQFPQVNIILTVSPIRYRKYGYHGSQLSKATLLLAIDKVTRDSGTVGQMGQFASAQFAVGQSGLPSRTAPRDSGTVGQWGQLFYFPSYEILNDELRDYRFYQADMLHPSDQAVDYIWERMAETFFSKETLTFLQAWKPIREALAHRPFDAASPAYQTFLKQTHEKARELQQRYPQLQLPF